MNIVLVLLTTMQTSFHFIISSNILIIFWNSRDPRKYTQKIINKCKSSNVIFASDYNTKNKDFTSHNLWSYVLSGGKLLTKDDDDLSDKEVLTIKTWEKNIPFVLSQYMTFDEFRKMYN